MDHGFYGGLAYASSYYELRKIFHIIEFINYLYGVQV
jgi:hypothetical protein